MKNQNSRFIQRSCQILLMLAGVTTGLSQFSPPPATVPDGEQPPGIWPRIVSAANLDVAVAPGSVLGGSGSDNLKVQIPSSGPYVWTESRHNEGDIAMLLSAHDPTVQPPNNFEDNYAIGTGPTTHAWRVNKFLGLALATPRVNGRDNGDTRDDQPVGTIYGVAYFNADFGQGWSYRMTDGVYANGGDGAQDLQMTLLGMGNAVGSSDGEANFDCAVAFFPYAQGWIGAHVLGSYASIGDQGEATFDATARSPLLYSNSVSWVINPYSGIYDHGHARIVLRSTDYQPETALLFGSATGSANQGRLFGAYPNEGGWDVAIRDAQDLDATGQTLTAAEGMSFMFLYVPTNAVNFVGGQIAGATGNQIIGGGAYTLTRTGVGNYELTIPGKTGSDGVLLLTVAGAMADSVIPNLPDRTTLSYVYSGGKFIIQSREAIAGDNRFGLAYPQRDTDFVFLWVDFKNPVAPRYPSGPIVDVPETELAPGPFPNQSASGANLDVAVAPGSVLGGSGSDNLKVQIPSSGPYVWTESRHNEGDIAMLLSAHDPTVQPPNNFEDNYAIGTGPTTHAWRVNKFLGLALATPRVNGRDNGDTRDDQPVGTIYGVAYFNADFGQGWSYRMTDGVYANGGDGAQDLQMTLLGMGNAVGSSDGEANFDCAVAFFPYAQGWIGAHVLGSYASIGDQGEATFDATARSPLLYSNSVSWVINPYSGIYDHGHARIVLRSTDYQPETALLFGSATGSANQGRLFGAYPNEGGWDVAIRDAQDLDATGQTLTAAEGMSFMFLYVPTNAVNFVGGQIAGATGNQIIGGGAYTLTRTGVGNYELTIPGKTGSDGVLLLTVAGAMADSVIPNLPDRTTLSYVYSGGKFIIQSREAIAGDNRFGLAYPQRDTDFVFLWVDFGDPLHPVGAPGQSDQLTIERTGANIALSWPLTIFNETLESSSSLSAANWAPVTISPIVSGEQKRVVLPATDAAQFYRLKRP